MQGEVPVGVKEASAQDLKDRPEKESREKQQAKDEDRAGEGLRHGARVCTFETCAGHEKFVFSSRSHASWADDFIN